MAAEPDTGIITDEALTKAAGTDNSDPALAARFLANDVAGSNDRDNATDGHDGHGDDDGHGDGSPRREWYGDSAYGTGDLRGAIDDAGHEAVIKPKPLQSAVEGGFTVDDFTVDEHGYAGKKRATRSKPGRS